MSAHRAFTLLELLLVLTVLGIVSALAAARLGGMRTSQGVEQAARMVQDQAQRAQHLAVARGQVVRLRLDPDARTTTVQLLAGTVASDPPDGSAAETALWSGAERLSLAFTRDDAAAVPDGAVDILFLPDARCDSPGRIAIASGERHATVRIAAGAQPAAVEP